MKKYIFLIMLSFLSCSQKSNKLNSDTAEGMPSPITPQQVSRCDIDTLALLTNARLADLLNEAYQAKLELHTRVDSIPLHARKFLDCLAGGNFSIANQNERWNSSCGFDKALPDRQITFVGVRKNIILITYYTGGIGKGHHALIMKSMNGQIRDFWCGTVDFEVENANQIILSIAQNQMNKWAIREAKLIKKHILNKNDTLLDVYTKEFIIRSRLAI